MHFNILRILYSHVGMCIYYIKTCWEENVNEISISTRWVWDASENHRAICCWWGELQRMKEEGVLSRQPESESFAVTFPLINKQETIMLERKCCRKELFLTSFTFWRNSMVMIISRPDYSFCTWKKKKNSGVNQLCQFYFVFWFLIYTGYILKHEIPWNHQKQTETTQNHTLLL